MWEFQASPSHTKEKAHLTKKVLISTRDTLRHVYKQVWLCRPTGSRNLGVQLGVMAWSAGQYD